MLKREWSGSRSAQIRVDLKKKRGGKGKERKDGDGLSPLRLVEMERKG